MLGLQQRRSELLQEDGMPPTDNPRTTEKVDCGQHARRQLVFLFRQHDELKWPTRHVSTAVNRRQHFSAADNKDAIELTRFGQLVFTFLDCRQPFAARYRQRRGCLQIVCGGKEVVCSCRQPKNRRRQPADNLRLSKRVQLVNTS